MTNKLTAMTAAMLFMAAGAAAQTTTQPKKIVPVAPSAAEQQEATLKVGDKAPPLSVESWVKGDKVEKFEKGKVYVVEFWATWCGPCIKGIPHLTEVQKEYKDKGVRILSIASSERTKDATGDISSEARLAKVKDFVTKQGDAMGYTVAYDDDRSMSNAWMKPANQRGIPCAFIVDKTGKIAWIGHPANGMDAALAKAVAAKGSASAGGSSVILASQPVKEKPKADKKDQPVKEKTKAEAKKDPADKGITLYMGDKAPELTVSKFVKGEPVTGFEKGKIYVVEFWATWCGPCIENIPHLTELQKEHKDIKVIGVSVWESDQAKVEPFVEKMGEKMDYTVAMDDLGTPEDGAAGRNASMSGKMAQNWMAASGQNGIPAAFIVNGDGKIAWIGHPATMEKPLAEIMAGKWDLQKEAAAYRKGKEMEEKVRPLTRKIQQSLQGGDFEAALAGMDELIAMDAKFKSQYSMQKFMILLTQADQPEKAYALGYEMVDGMYNDNAQMLNQLAWTIVDPQGPEIKNRDLKLALKAAKRADDLTKHEDPAILDTLAKVYFDSGELGKALEIQEQAAKAGEGTQFEGEINDRLKEYKAAVKKKGL